MVGISGEHIADYICAYTFGWGRDWQGHDDGGAGRWTKGTPSAKKLGKLSKGGTPKSRHVLYRLADGANGVGIDAVWHTDGHNGGKPYAIVEAKATRDEDAPKFLRKLNNTRKPGTNQRRFSSVLIQPQRSRGQTRMGRFDCLPTLLVCKLVGKLRSRAASSASRSFGEHTCPASCVPCSARSSWPSSPA